MITQWGPPPSKFDEKILRPTGRNRWIAVAAGVAAEGYPRPAGGVCRSIVVRRGDAVVRYKSGDPHSFSAYAIGTTAEIEKVPAVA